MTIEQILRQLQSARSAYYNGDAIMSDAEFDELEDKLRALDPQNGYFSAVGTSPDEEVKKITHPEPMLSMQKAKSIAELQKWAERLALESPRGYCVQPKIDGLSATLFYRNGKLEYIATRGDGISGQDVTHLSNYLCVPNEISIAAEECEVRGELYLPKNTEFDTQGKPLRNNCVGLVNRKENLEDQRHIRFAAYQITGDNSIELESDIFPLLEKMKFSVVPVKVFATIEEIAQYYELYLTKIREEWLFETDGLVVTVNDRTLFDEIDSRWVLDHHHHYAIALKPPAEARETKLLSIQWQVSRQGNAIPVALFEPVSIGGAKISRASLSNAETVRRMDVRAGDTLLIERANDVIPYVRDNISARSRGDANPSLIEICPSCGSSLVTSGVHLKCENRECPETNIQKILFWVRQSGMEQIAEATVRRLYESNLIRTIRDLYHIQESSIAALEGFAEKKTKSFIKEIEKARSMSAAELIAKLGIPLVQKKALKKLKIESIDDFKSFNNDGYIIGQNIISWRETPGNLELLEELAAALDITAAQTAVKGKVCMTGSGPKPRKELIKDIELRGYEFSETVTADTAILLSDDPQSTSSKTAKARKLGVEIKSYEEFLS